MEHLCTGLAQKTPTQHNNSIRVLIKFLEVGQIRAHGSNITDSYTIIYIFIKQPPIYTSLCYLVKRIQGQYVLVVSMYAKLGFLVCYSYMARRGM